MVVFIPETKFQLFSFQKLKKKPNPKKQQKQTPQQTKHKKSQLTKFNLECYLHLMEDTAHLFFPPQEL